MLALIWEHCLALVVYILAAALYFNTLCIFIGPSMSRRQYFWTTIRAIAWPIDILGTVVVWILDAYREWRLK